MEEMLGRCRKNSNSQTWTRLKLMDLTSGKLTFDDSVEIKLKSRLFQTCCSEVLLFGMFGFLVRKFPFSL